jgi:hypothetical protein
MLRILTPRDNETITLPAEVRYEIAGFDAGLPPGVHLHLLIGNPAVGDPIELDLASLAGTVTLPDDKNLAGRRDLIFVLAQPDHTAFPNPQASVTIRGVIIMGRR